MNSSGSSTTSGSGGGGYRRRRSARCRRVSFEADVVQWLPQSRRYARALTGDAAWGYRPFCANSVGLILKIHIDQCLAKPPIAQTPPHRRSLLQATLHATTTRIRTERTITLGPQLKRTVSGRLRGAARRLIEDWRVARAYHRARLGSLPVVDVHRGAKLGQVLVVSELHPLNAAIQSLKQWDRSHSPERRAATPVAAWGDAATTHGSALRRWAISVSTADETGPNVTIISSKSFFLSR